MPALLQAAGTAGELPGGYGAALLQAVLALAAVCLLAWVSLRWLARRGVGVPGGRGRIRVLERAPLDARRSLYLVRVGPRIWLVGAGEGAALSVLAELSEDELPEAAPEESRSFASVLARAAGRGERR
ncbi:MAG: flagellar biosynthetic protein FliO [Myxococcota bacterium]